MKREERFVKEVIAKMTKSGINCGMENNRLVIQQDGKRFDVCMWKTPGWSNRRVHFVFSFGFQEMANIKTRGLLWLVSECNNHSDYTTTQLMGDQFVCRVETSVRSTKDFAREFEFASKQIGLIIDNIVNNFPVLQQNFSKQPKRVEVGFLASRERQCQENNEACRLAAHNDDNFAA